MSTVITILACVGAGTVGGVFFAFSTFVMKALLQMPPGQGVAAMQRINVAVINPLFLGVLIGTVAIEAVCVLLTLAPWNGARSMLILAAALVYAIGTFLVTMRFNVPRNNRLAQLDAGSLEAATYWPVYVREWLTWNHVRTASALVSSACSATALTL